MTYKDGILLKCVTVYTKDFELFSDIYEEILNTSLKEHEEKEISGVLISEAGMVSKEYVDRMKAKPEVVVMRVKQSDITIIQHSGVFEIFFPEKENLQLV
jgi:hypothetical protein